MVSGVGRIKMKVAAGVRRLPVNGEHQAPASSCHLGVKKGNGAVSFTFNRELDGGMN